MDHYALFTYKNFMQHHGTYKIVTTHPWYFSNDVKSFSILVCIDQTD